MCSSLTFHNNNFLSLFTIHIYFLIVLNNVTFRTRIVILGHCERWNVLNVGSSADLVMPVLWATSKYEQYHHIYCQARAHLGFSAHLGVLSGLTLFRFVMDTAYLASCLSQLTQLCSNLQPHRISFGKYDVLTCKHTIAQYENT